MNILIQKKKSFGKQTEKFLWKKNDSLNTKMHIHCESIPSLYFYFSFFNQTEIKNLGNFFFKSNWKWNYYQFFTHTHTFTIPFFRVYEDTYKNGQKKDAHLKWSNVYMWSIVYITNEPQQNNDDDDEDDNSQPNKHPFMSWD